ncbi:prepilin-type N-terminal cleavage/methylation domain-containing protein [Jeotgalibacillus malaysiensis]
MKKIMKLLKNNKAFTLIEMVIVLLVISVLLIVSLPNISSQSKEINGKGCEAFQHIIDIVKQHDKFTITKGTINQMKKHEISTMLVSDHPLLQKLGLLLNSRSDQAGGLSAAELSDFIDVIHVEDLDAYIAALAD